MDLRQCMQYFIEDRGKLVNYIKISNCTHAKVIQIHF